MKSSKAISVLCSFAALVSVADAVASSTRQSEPALVFLQTETSSFWNTATNNLVSVPIDFPPGATLATLTVSGVDYSATYPDIGTGTKSLSLSLPEADGPQTENVYDLTLTFNDSTVRTAKIGLISGQSPDAEGTTRCLAPSGSRVWERVKNRAVLPIPYGTTEFSVTVNGEERFAETDMDGAQGWFALGVNVGDSVSLSRTTGGVSQSVSLTGMGDGMVIIAR